MSATGTARQFEAEDLARAKNWTQIVLDDWDFITWNDLLANEVVLSLRLGSIGIGRIGDLDIADGNLQVTGREEAKRVLKSIYDDIRHRLCVTTEILSGYDAVLLGEMALGVPVRPCPCVIYMQFDSVGKIRVMTIAAVDLHTLTDAIRSAAQTGILKAA